MIFNLRALKAWWKKNDALTSFCMLSNCRKMKWLHFQSKNVMYTSITADFVFRAEKSFHARLKLSISVLTLSLYLGYKCSAKDTINDVVAEQTKNGNGKLVLVTLSTFFWNGFNVKNMHAFYVEFIHRVKYCIWHGIAEKSCYKAQIVKINWFSWMFLRVTCTVILHAHMKNTG